MAKVNVSVSIKDEHLPRFAEAVQHLKKKGFQVEQALESVGVVTGSIDSARLAALKQIPAVANVEEARTVQIAPPESEVQ